MSLLSFNSLVCWQITLTLLHVSWIGLVIGLIAASANRLLRDSAASQRYWTNFASLLLFAASLPVAFAIVRSETAEVAAARIVAETPVAEIANLSLPVVEEPAFSTPPTDDEDFAPNPPQSLPSDTEIPEAVPSLTVIQPTPSVGERISSIGHTAAPFVAILYAIGVALMFMKLAFGVRVSRQLRSASQPISDATILARLADQAKKLSLRMTPVVAYCEHTAVPIVVGLLRPMILIPAAMVNGLTIEQLESVLTHELAHLRRRDLLMIVLQRVLEAILFFHPVTWYLSHRLHDDRETSCDDLVLSIGGDRLQYAQSLLRVAELRLATQSHQKHIALAADGQCPSKLRQRIARLLEDPKSDSVRVSSVWLVVTVLAFLMVGIVSMSSTIRPAFAAVQDDAELDYEGVLRLASKAYENPAPVTTAHVRFRIAELHDGVREGMTSEKCRQLLSESGVTSQPDKLKVLLGLMIKEPDQLEAKPWTSVDLYQGESGIRTTTSTSTHGPDYWVGGQWSYRWDSAKSQASLLRREDDRFHEDETLDEFLRNRRMTFANLKFEKPFSIRKKGDKILLQYDDHPERQQETTLDAVSGRIHSVANSSHGVVHQERLQLGWRAFNEDIWLPTVIAEFRYRRDDLDHCRIIVIEDASFNQPLPADVFRFRVPAGSVISDKRIGLNRTYTINRDVADVTSDGQLEAAAAPGNATVDARPSSIHEQINRIGEAVMENLHRDEINYINDTQREQFVTELKERLATRVSLPLPAAEFDKVVSAISHFFRDSYGDTFTSFYDQDAFMISFSLLEWRIWVGMDPVELTADESTRRENQREWFRSYIHSQHPDGQKRVTYMSKAGNKVEMTPREYDLFMYEQLLNDPTYPFLFFPLSDDRFIQIKESLELKPATTWYSKNIYDEYESCHYGKVTNRWPLPKENAIGILYSCFGYLVGVYDISLATRNLSTIGHDRDIEEKENVIPARLRQPVVLVDDEKDQIPSVTPTTEFTVIDGDGRPITDGEVEVTGTTDKEQNFACTVIDPNGKPVKGAMLLLSGDDHYREYDRGETPTTDADGFVQVPKIPVGPLEFTIFSLDWAPVTMKVSIPQAAPVTVIMQKGKRVEFRAVDLQGNPIAGIRFYPEAPRLAVPSPDQIRMFPHDLDFLAHRDVLNVRTNADGLFVWENAPDMKLGYQVISSQYLSQPGGEYGPEGSPHTLVFRPVIPVSMTIFDATTGSPIADARIMQGTHFKSNRAGSWSWNWASEKSNGEGRLYTKLHALDRVIRFRVQAKGYRPVLSQEFDAAALPDSPISLQIRLHADAGFSGTALQPDGRPAAGARIYTISRNISNASETFFVINGIVDESKVASVATADMNGRFQMPPHVEPFECLIVHDSGYLKLMDVELRQQSELELMSWASVKGELWLQGAPAVNVGVQLLMFDDVLDEYSRLPCIGFSQNIRTDAAGKFTFPKCIAGEWEKIIAYDEKVTSTRSGEYNYVHHDTFQLLPGQERHEVIGRDGADVVGRVVFPADLEIETNECDISVENIDARMLNGGRNGQSYDNATLEPDGSFHLFNLPVATHEIQFFLPAMGEQFPRTRYTQKIVVTPERFVGKSPTNPIDLGEIQVEPVK